MDYLKYSENVSQIKSILFLCSSTFLFFLICCVSVTHLLCTCLQLGCKIVHLLADKTNCFSICFPDLSFLLFYIETMYANSAVL